MRVNLGFGAGLRTRHYDEIFADGAPRLDWYEAITENHMVPGGQPRRMLHRVRERAPVVLHGVSLSIGSTDPLNPRYLDDLAAFCAEIEPTYVSDHLCWSSFGGHYVHDLWPLPLTEEALAHVASRVHTVQDKLRRPILLENASTYAAFCASQLDEAAFLSALCARTGCGLLLDVNNVYVSAQNHGFDPDAYLQALPVDRVAQIHLAGHTDLGTHLLDTHDHPVCDEVWALYRRAVARFGDVPTMIEWDDHIPPFARLVEEVERARAVAAEVRTEVRR